MEPDMYSNENVETMEEATNSEQIDDKMVVVNHLTPDSYTPPVTESLEDILMRVPTQCNAIASNRPGSAMFAVNFSNSPPPLRGTASYPVGLNTPTHRDSEPIVGEDRENSEQNNTELNKVIMKLAESMDTTNKLLRKHLESMSFMRHTIFRSYTKSINSPTPMGEVKTNPVEVRCCFLKIVDVNTLKQNFEAEIFLEARWPEAELIRVPTEELDSLDYSQFWNPKIMVQNVEGQLISDRSSYSARHFSDKGRVMMVMRRRIKGLFRENLELEHFPFDVQELTIQVSTERSTEEVIFQEDTLSLSTVNTEAFLDSQEWKIYEHVEVTGGYTTVEDANATTRPILHFQCRVARKVGYFFWNIAFVMFLISALSFSVFSIGVLIPNRLQTTITLLLTAVAFKMVAKQHLPTISYLTYLDIYVIACLVFLSLQAVQNAAAAAAVHSLGEDSAQFIDKTSVAVLLVALVMFHILFGIYIYSTAFKRRRLMNKKDREYKLLKNQQERQKYANHHVTVAATLETNVTSPAARFL